MTHTEASSATTNDTQGPQKYPHHQQSECHQNVTTPQQSATKKHLFLYLKGDKSGLRKPKKDNHQH